MTLPPFDIPALVAATALPDAMPRALTSADEQRLLRGLTARHYSGAGEICELGSGVGASTVALCLGLQDNKQVADKTGRIHAYDYFAAQPNRGQGGTGWFFTDEKPGPEPVSFFHEFQNNIAPWRSNVQVCRGALQEAEWTGPIEILFVDIAKSIALFKSVAGVFLPHLMTGGILAHQDFDQPTLPWIHYSLGAMLPWLRIEGQLDHTLVTTLQGTLPDALLARLAADDFTLDEKHRLISELETALPRAPGAYEFIHASADFRFGALEAAREKAMRAREINPALATQYERYFNKIIAE